MLDPTKRLSVVVKSIEGEDVERHINMLGAKQKRRSTHSSGLSSEFLNNVQPIQRKKSSAVSFKTAGNENSNEESENVAAKLIQSLGDMNDPSSTISGAAVYGFKTPKRSKQMNKFASESARKIRTLQKSFKKENEKPHTLESVKENETATTPSQNLRHKKRYCIQEMNAPPEDSDSTDDSESESEVPDEGGDKNKQNRTKSVSFAPEERNAQDKNGSARRLDLPTETELYFEAHKGGRKLMESTSDRTLGKLKLPRMDREKMQTILESHQESKKTKGGKAKDKANEDAVVIEKTRLRLVSEHRQHFQKWMFYLCNGFNILLYGLGSKRKLVHDFCNKTMEDHAKIVVNGYFPSLTMKSILTSIFEEVLNENVVSNNPQTQVDTIRSRYSEENENMDHLFLIIHNIDGFPLRNSKAQSVISQLATAKRIHLVATTDHINASLVWDQSKLGRYKWLWFDVTTYEPYTDETSYEDSLLLLTSGTGIGGSLALSGLVHVARSLTPNARGIFKLLAEFQIEESKESSGNYIGLSFSDLYQQCRERFLVNSELTLRTQLTEFLDHKLVQIKKGGDGGEYLSIPLDISTLQEYLDQAEN